MGTGVEAHPRDGNITDQIVVTGSMDMNKDGNIFTNLYRTGRSRESCHRQVHSHGGGQPHRGLECYRCDGHDLVSHASTFTIGSPTTEAGRGADENQTEVTLSFYLGKYEVTQAQYEAVMKGNSIGMNPNQVKSLDLIMCRICFKNRYSSFSKSA